MKKQSKYLAIAAAAIVAWRLARRQKLRNSSAETPEDPTEEIAPARRGIGRLDGDKAEQLWRYFRSRMSIKYGQNWRRSDLNKEEWDKCLRILNIQRIIANYNVIESAIYDGNLYRPDLITVKREIVSPEGSPLYDREKDLYEYMEWLDKKYGTPNWSVDTIDKQYASRVTDLLHLWRDYIIAFFPDAL